MYDIIGKRRWLYLFSLILTIPGLVLILLTPFTDLGLQFSIDYTGGTRWVIRFDDRAVTPEQVRAVFDENGLSRDGHPGVRRLPRDPHGAGRGPARGAGAVTSAGPSAAPSGSASPAPSGSPSASPSASPMRESVGVPVRLGQPRCLGVARCLGLARRIGLAESSRAHGQHRDPDRRAARCDRHDPPGPLRPDREPDRPHVDRRSREQ